MKKESSMGLFFLMAVGIVGLGLYYGATEDYGSGEIQLYHFICWVILVIALLRSLELVWEPVKFLWDQAWGKVQETRRENQNRAGNQNQAENQSNPINQSNPVTQNNMGNQNSGVNQNGGVNQSSAVNQNPVPVREPVVSVLSDEEMETAIIVPEFNQRIYVEKEAVPVAAVVPQVIQGKKKKHKNKKKK